MRRVRVWAATLSVATAAVCGSSAAGAQTFWQKMFGLGGPAEPPSQAQPETRIIPPARLNPPVRAVPANTHSPEPKNNDDDERAGPPDTGGPYRTVCVRLCDGFYFPVRYNARRKNFASDANSCRNACGTEARLFYHPTWAGADAMVDTSGRKYADLPHAFAYRTALKSGCACKPVPWSAEEAARHQSYADVAAHELEQDKAKLAAQAEAEAAKLKPVAQAAAATRDGVAVVYDIAAGPQPPDDLIVATGAKPAQATVAGSAETEPQAEAANVGPAKRGDTARRAQVRSRPTTRVRVARSGAVQTAGFKASSGAGFFGSGKSYRWPGD